MKKSLIFLLLFVLTLALCFTVPGVAAVAEEGIAYNEMQSVTTGLINPATTVTEIKSSADINKAVSSKANVVLVDFDAGLNVTAEDGSAICGVSALPNSLRTGTLIGYKIENAEELDALVSYMSANGVTDSYLVCKDEQLLYNARKKYSMALGVLDLRGQTVTADNVVSKTNAGFSKIAIVDGEGLTLEAVESMRKRYVTVWAEDTAPTRASAVKTVLTGVNGVLTDDVSVYNSAYTEFFKKANSVVRRSFTIGHRGSTATYGGYSDFGPENTLESAKKACADGVDYVEIDVHFTLDRELVIMHDSTLGTMMNASGLVETTNYSDLLNYTYKNFDDSYKIPTLRQMIEYFKTTDCMLVIELKEYTNNLAVAVTDLVKEMDFEDQCVIICFSKQTLNDCYNNAPNIACGALDSTDYRVYEKIYDEKHDVYKNGELVLSDTLQSIIASTNGFNNAFNPAYTVVTEKLTKQLAMRGIGTQLWTVTTASQIDMYVNQGVSSVTIDGAAMIAQNIKTVSTDKQEYTAEIGSDADVKVYGNYYARSDYEGNAVAPLDLTDDTFAVPMIVDGDSFEVDGNKLRAVKEGESVVVYRYKAFSSSGEYYLYSQPITVKAVPVQANQGGGCGSVAGAGAIGFAVLLCGAAILKKKEI